MIVLHALLFRLFMSGFWWNYSIASLYNRYRTRGLLGYVMYLFEFLVSYRSSFLLLTNDLNLFNLSIRCSINFRLHKSLHDSRESEVCIPLQILNFKSQLKSQVNAIRATTIFLWLKGTIDGLSDRAFDRLNGTSWITEERFAPGTFIATTFAVPPTLLLRQGLKTPPFHQSAKIGYLTSMPTMNLHGTCKRIFLEFGCFYNCHSEQLALDGALNSLIVVPKRVKSDDRSRA